MADNVRDELDRYLGELDDKIGMVSEALDEFLGLREELNSQVNDLDDLMKKEIEPSLVKVPREMEKNLSAIFKENQELLSEIDLDSDSDASDKAWNTLDAVNNYISYFDDIDNDFESINDGFADVIEKIEDIIKIWSGGQEKLEPLSENLLKAIEDLEKALKK